MIALNRTSRMYILTAVDSNYYSSLIVSRTTARRDTITTVDLAECDTYLTVVRRAELAMRNVREGYRSWDHHA